MTSTQASRCSYVRNIVTLYVYFNEIEVMTIAIDETWILEIKAKFYSVSSVMRTKNLPKSVLHDQSYLIVLKHVIKSAAF